MESELQTQFALWHIPSQKYYCNKDGSFATEDSVCKRSLYSKAMLDRKIKCIDSWGYMHNLHRKDFELHCFKLVLTEKRDINL